MHQWHIIGDSHIEAINYAIQQGWITAQAKCHIVPGATSVGLRNPNSVTNAVTIFKECLFPVVKNTIPVIQLGEVDCGFVIWWRAEKLKETVESQLHESVRAYFEFVDDIVSNGYPSVVISGAVLPTILDGQRWGDIANKRQEVQASLKSRTLLTLRYNEMLRKGAILRSLPYIEITKSIIDTNTGVIADEFRNPDPCDHHIDPHKAGRLWATTLNDIDSSRIGAKNCTSVWQNIFDNIRSLCTVKKL